MIANDWAALAVHMGIWGMMIAFTWWYAHREGFRQGREYGQEKERRRREHEEWMEEVRQTSLLISGNPNKDKV